MVRAGSTRSPRPEKRRRRTDLTSRFLQFGVLENQCADGYLAVPIAVQFGLLAGPPMGNPGIVLRGAHSRKGEAAALNLIYAAGSFHPNVFRSKFWLFRTVTMQFLKQGLLVGEVHESRLNLQEIQN